MASKLLRAIEGTRDYFDKDGARLEKAFSSARDVFTRFGYSKITTPVFETTPLFARSIGEATDIVEKEMYTFTPGSDTITLRPEGTAGVVRAYLQHSMHKQGGMSKLWYAGPMFRRERPQKGRQRQFHQVGVEAIGSADPMLDAEVIQTGLSFYEEAGIEGVKTRINSIGCSAEGCRSAYRELLKKEIGDRLGSLCKVCQNRYERNVLRILDCKNENCRKVVADLPKSYEHLCEDCNSHFETVKETLDAYGVAYTVDSTLVRGLDYYSKTVFEYSHGSLGAQDAIGGGGRYDGLVEELGGPSVPAVGFAIGVERVMIAMEVADACACTMPLMVYGIGLGDEARKSVAGLLSRIRAAGYTADMDFEGRSFKAQMRTANRREAMACIILGEDELEKGMVVLKDMREGGGQEEVPLEELTNALSKIVRL